MKLILKLRRTAFTLIEMTVVIALIAVLAAMMWASRPRQLPDNRRITCLNNLKEIGTAYQLWAVDNGHLRPPQQSIANGGWKDLLTNANQGVNCWTNYAIMANELGQSPKLVVCPYDERQAATNFKTGFDNTHLSYFVGAGADDIFPQSIAGGDRNLGFGVKPDPDYGFSPKSGQGNDVALPVAGPVSWSLKMHSAGNPAGKGNILLGDGSGQQVLSSAAFNQNWLRNAAAADNWSAGHVPTQPSIRLVFP